MITLDANLYISALQFKGKPDQLLNLAAKGNLDVAISAPILGEVLRILREKFAWPEDDLAKADLLIRESTHMVVPTQTLRVITEDPDDDRVLECAVASGSEAIVTGDKDLLRRGHYQGIRIVTPAQFLEGLGR